MMSKPAFRALASHLQVKADCGVIPIDAAGRRCLMGNMEKTTRFWTRNCREFGRFRDGPIVARRFSDPMFVGLSSRAG
jgi:hypothetical protein